MVSLLTVEKLEKSFDLPGGRRYVALKHIDLELRKGEFVALVGHSGCGKSTLLNMVAGLDLPTAGSVSLLGRPVRGPGPDRMVVFQNYSLLPWLTVRENIALAVNQVYPDRSPEQRAQIVEEHMRLVNLQQAAERRPAQLSGGMKQRVAIARALAIRPELLLLDEPFGALDALTRGNLQQQLMRILDETQASCLMVTHDVDEALLLSDRIVMLTNGPASRIGQILEVPFPRPRQRLEVLAHPSYYSLRSEIIYFLNQQKRIKQLKSRQKAPIARHGLEKVNLEIGYLPVTACAPLVVAEKMGFFARHGLEAVQLVREPSWRAIVDGIADGYLDAAQMPAGLPLWFSLGGHAEKPLPVVTALTLARGGNAITFGRRFLNEGIGDLVGLRDYLQATRDQAHVLGVVHPASMHNLLLRYWLAAGGIDPDEDVTLSTLPPAQMIANLRTGSLDGFCVGEPWNTRAEAEGLGFTIATDREVWPGHPAKVLGVREDWAQAYPNTHLALVKALLEACRWCADPANRAQLRMLLAGRSYLDTDPNLICLPASDFNPAQYRPSRTEQLWVMTQLARWGQTPFPRNWVEVLERLCRVQDFGTAARELGLEVSYRREPIELFDGGRFDAEDPVGYLNRFALRGALTIAEVPLGAMR